MVGLGNMGRAWKQRMVENSRQVSAQLCRYRGPKKWMILARILFRGKMFRLLEIYLFKVYCVIGFGGWSWLEGRVRWDQLRLLRGFKG